MSSAQPENKTTKRVALSVDAILLVLGLGASETCMSRNETVENMTILP